MSAQPSAMEPRLRTFRIDLHVHTALSPCASMEMTPPVVALAAWANGLDMIAVCDHNSAGNVAAVQRAAELLAESEMTRTGGAAAARAGRSLTVLAGMEIASVEEVHVVGVFPDLAAAVSVSDRLRSLLPPADADYYAFFGEQPLLEADGSPLGTESAALAAAIPLDLSETVELIHSSGGLAIAAHIDRKAFGVFSQLGFFPKNAGFDAVELTYRVLSDAERVRGFASLGLPMTTASDSHFVEEVGQAVTELTAVEPTFSELALALAGTAGRRVAYA